MTVWGAIELGGTKGLAAVAAGPEDLTQATRVSTTNPETTFRQLLEVIEGSDLAGVGIASFGPLDLDPMSPSYGQITATPKPGWSWTDLVGPVATATAAPVVVETDVNAAAVGEARWGSAVGFSQVAYVTIGTGIGGGYVIEGVPLHGNPHPELGHTVVRQHPDDGFAGVCPFHGGCLEGMASGAAILARFGSGAERLSTTELAEARNLVAYYVAQGLRNLMYVASPQRIVVGGGLTRIEGLVDAVKERLSEELADYPASGSVDLQRLIVAPGLGDHSGLAGALAIAMNRFL